MHGVGRGTGKRGEFRDAAERHAKLRLAYALNQVLENRELSQADAAKALGVTLAESRAHERPVALASSQRSRTPNNGETQAHFSTPQEIGNCAATSAHSTPQRR